MADAYALSGLIQPGQRLQEGEYDELLLPTFGGLVEGTIVKQSIMQDFLAWRSVTGTNTLTNYRHGKTAIQVLTPGSNPQPTPMDFDNISLKIDTVILARANEFILHDVQNIYEAKAAVATEQGKEIGKFIDSVGIIKGIKSARQVAGDGSGGTVKLPDGWTGGTQINLTTAGDENDPNLLQYAIEGAVAAIQEKDIDPASEGFVIFVRPAQYWALARADKLINSDYSTGNGDTAQGMVLKAAGLPIRMTNRLPKAAIPNHPLSNAANNYAYNLSAAEARAVVLIMSPRAVLAGTSIPLSHDIFWDRQTKSHFIDSWLALGATENRGEFAAVVNRA